MKIALVLLAVMLLLVACTPSKSMDVGFVDQPHIKPSEKRRFIVVAPFVFYIEQEHYVVPEGFETDLASVPRALWSFYPPTDSKTIAPAVAHDYLYHCKEDGVTRKVADDAFYYGLVKQGMSKRKARHYYTVVRLFGWLFYKPRECYELD